MPPPADTYEFDINDMISLYADRASTTEGEGEHLEGVAKEKLKHADSKRKRRTIKK